jgi:hypothetical protein
MARRFTPNGVSTLDELDGLFAAVPIGGKHRVRCVLCEQEKQTTHAAARRWMRDHECVEAKQPDPWWPDLARGPYSHDCQCCGWRNFTVRPNGVPRYHVPSCCQACGAPIYGSVAA